MPRVRQTHACAMHDAHAHINTKDQNSIILSSQIPFGHAPEYDVGNQLYAVQKERKKESNIVCLNQSDCQIAY